MEQIDLSKEIGLYSPKIIQEKAGNIPDLYSPINQVAIKVEELAKVGKKNVIQFDNISESLKSELEQKNEEIRGLKVEINEQKKINLKTVNCLISVLDQIDNIYKFCVESNNTFWVNSLNATYKLIEKNMKEIGLTEIPAYGEIFDEQIHNSVDSVDAPTKRQYEIVDVTKRGYRYNGKVIRYADVVTAK